MSEEKRLTLEDVNGLTALLCATIRNALASFHERTGLIPEVKIREVETTAHDDTSKRVAYTVEADVHLSHIRR